MNLHNQTKPANYVNRLQRSEGLYTLVYAAHSLPIDTAQIPKDIDGLFLEYCTYIDEQEKVEIPRFLNAPEQNGQYATILTHEELNKVSIYFPDFDYNAKYSWRPERAIDLEHITNLQILCNPRYRASLEAREDMRDFNDECAILHYKADQLSAEEVLEESRRILQKYNIKKQGDALRVPIEKQSSDASRIMLRARELVIAYKERWLMRQLNNPHFITHNNYRCMPQQIRRCDFIA